MQCFSLRCIFASVTLPLALSALAGAQAGKTVTLYPGQDVQSFVAAYPSGTTFHLTAGVYWNQSITPKDNDVFQGDPGTYLTGGRYLGGSIPKGSNGLHYVYSQYQQGQTNGICDAQHPACMYPEDLFINDVPLLRVTSISQVGPGKWFFDYAHHQIVLADDTTGKRLETSLTTTAFAGSAANVKISNLVIQKYANPAQFGAIGGQYPGPGWVISGVETWLNHGPGIWVASGGQVLNCIIHNQGSIGVGSANSSGVLLQGNDISHNNFAGFMKAFESGGAKFTATNGLVLNGNRFHSNHGSGVWTDTDNRNTTYENNIIYDNEDLGIQHENSFTAVIKNNIVFNNGAASTGWLWGSQILVQNSQNVEVVGNTVNAPAGYGNGIGIVNQNRGSGQFGPYVSQHNYVHNNDITYQPGAVALTGVAADYDFNGTFAPGNNVFDYNAYHTNNPNGWNWAFWGPQTWSGFIAQGQEFHGTIDANIKPRPAYY